MYATFVTSFLIRVVARGPLGAGSDCGRCNVLRKTQLKSYPLAALFGQFFFSPRPFLVGTTISHAKMKLVQYWGVADR
jgi:hypothetical protein